MFHFATAYTQPCAEDYETLVELMNPQLAPFVFGIASGDPGVNSVILWTALWLPEHTQVEVGWEVASDEAFQQKVSSGSETVSLGAKGTPVNVEALGLSAGTSYYYRFECEGKFSPTGRTRTLPAEGVQSLRFAVVSCQNYEAGFYNAYTDIAGRKDLQAVIHLGDYIYEYQAGRYSNKIEGRNHLPSHELVHADDYHLRYAQYRLDPNLQAVHAAHPFISIWDDHEFANDSYVDGAQNHQANEGPWEERKRAAKEAYFAWLPLRGKPDEPLYREFSFGSLASLWMLDGRMAGRTVQAKSSEDPLFLQDNRHILGPDQLEWLIAGMLRSTAQWRIIGNPVIMSTVDTRKALPNISKFMDMWDGYPAERKRLIGFMEENGFDNVVVVSGDSHTSWAADLVVDPDGAVKFRKKQCPGCVGAEFTTPSITSANYDEYVPRWKAREAQRRFTRWGRNPHVHYTDVTRHGYQLLTLTSEYVRADWIYVRRLDQTDPRVKKSKSRYLVKGKRGIRKRT